MEIFQDLNNNNPKLIIFNVPIRYSKYLDVYEYYRLKKVRTNTYLVDIISSDGGKIEISIPKTEVLYCDNRIIVVSNKICNIEELLYFGDCLISNPEGDRLYLNRYILGDKVYKYICYINDKVANISIYECNNYVRSVLCYNFVIGKEYLILDKEFARSNGLYCL